MAEERICQDCGVIVEQMSNGRWGQRLRESHWGGACRKTLTADGTRLIEADYHYVKGEVQRHFKANDA
jgi:hypothetical protein